MRNIAEPNPNLRACVVVPARNEEDLVGHCLQALAGQSQISPEDYEVILVLDGCTDETEDRAREIGRTNPELRLHLLEGPAEGAGHARRVGMEAACTRLLSLGRERGLIASTDADTVVARDWLAAQLGCVDHGARAIGGRIELADDQGLPEDVTDWRAERGRQRHMDLLSEANGNGPRYLEHWQFSGASLALTAEVYKEIGGLEPHAALEDENLERILHQRSIPIERPISVKVTTSARLIGRASHGLARDLSLANWFEANTYRARGWDAEEILARKNTSISAIVVVDDSERASRHWVNEILAHRRSGLLDEVLVLSSGTVKHDLPPEAIVRRVRDLLPSFGPARGYGDILWRAISAIDSEVLVFLQPDVAGESVPALIRPLLDREELALIKGFHGHSVVRPDVLARPLINLYRPELAGFIEPLSKNFAARRSLLETLPFPVGDGAMLSLLFDAARDCGVASVAQTELSSRETAPAGNTSPETAYAVLTAAIRRTEHETPPLPGPLFAPSPEGLKTHRVPLEERPPLTSLNEPTYARQTSD